MSTPITPDEWRAIQQVYIKSLPFRRFYDSERSKIGFPIQWAEDRTLASGTNALFTTSVYPDGSLLGNAALPELPIPLLSDVIAAHELTHPILHAEGFPAAYTRDSHNATITAALASLLTDRVINRRLLAYGFDLATHCRARLDNHRRTLESVTTEPKSAGDRLLWICNIVAALLEAQQTGVDTAEYQKWIASRYPKITRAALRTLDFVKRTGYQTPNQHRKILATLASEYQIRDVRIASLAEMIAFARRKGQSIQIAADGATWSTEQQLSANYSNAFLQAPGLYVSSKTAGRAYTTIMTATSDGPPSAGRQTADYGATWSALSSPDLAGTNLAMDIHVPFNDNPAETLSYFSSRDRVSPMQKLFRVSGGVQTDITPVVSGKAYTMQQYGQGSLTTNPTNRQRVLLCACHNDDLSIAPSHFAVFVSQDAGNNWTVIDGPGTTEKYIMGAITDNNTIYVWGRGGRVGYCTDFATIDERGPGGSARIVGITGN